MTVNGSAPALTVLAPERETLVVEVEYHQHLLARYAPAPGQPPRQVLAELVHAPLTRGRHAGRSGIEVRIGGRRIGELTFTTVMRYGPVLAPALARAERVGCQALVGHGRNGLIEVGLRLPEERHVPISEPLPAVRSDRSHASRDKRPGVVAATVVGLAMAGGLVALGAVTGGMDARPATPSVPSERCVALEAASFTQADARCR